MHAIDRQDGQPGLKVGRCSKALAAKIEKLNLPVWLKQLLWWSWPRQGGMLHGGHNVFSVAEILKHDDLDAFLAGKMLPIGCSVGNGDPLVIRFDEDSGAVGFACLETLWSHLSDLRDVYARITPTVEEYLLRVHDRLFLPFDSFEAGEFDQLRRELTPNVQTASKRTRYRSGKRNASPITPAELWRKITSSR